MTVIALLEHKKVWFNKGSLARAYPYRFIGAAVIQGGGCHSL